MTAQTAPQITGAKIRRAAFYVVVVAFAVFHLLPPSLLVYVILGWFLEGDVITHRVHEISFGFIFALSFAGLLAQLRKPERKVGAVYLILIPLLFTMSAVMLIDRFIDPFALAYGITPLIVLALHPAWREVLHPRVSWSRALVALSLVATIPLVWFAVNQLQTGVEATAISKRVEAQIPPDASDEVFERIIRENTSSPQEVEAARHAGHWSAMGAFALTIVALAGIASARPLGSRAPAFGAGLAAIGYGVVSLVFPEDSSAAPMLWAVLAVLWGAGFIVMSEREARRRPAVALEAPPEPVPA